VAEVSKQSHQKQGVDGTWELKRLRDYAEKKKEKGREKDLLLTPST
jgi:hypothetical protein